MFKFDKVWTSVKKVSEILSPFTYGFIIAYLCNPLMMLFERTILKSSKLSHKLRRSLSLTLTVISVLALISLFALLVVPQVTASYFDLQSQVSGYVYSAQAWADNFVRNFSLFNGQYENLAEFLDVNAISTDFKNLISNSFSLIQAASNYVISYAGRFVIEVKNLVMGFILSVYFLFSKEKLASQFKKLLSGIMSRKHYLNLISVARYSNETFGGFITGKLLDSLIIALLTFIVLGICRMPYYPLISVIVGVTNIIPIFGPFIGAIPSAFIIFIAEPKKALWFIIIIIIIQQIDGNIIGPKILGDSIGLSALWIVVSITVFGGMFGITGMIMGVPAFAVLYTLVKEITEKRLRSKRMPSETSFYAADPPMRDLHHEKLLIYSDEEAEMPRCDEAADEAKSTEAAAPENGAAADVQSSVKNGND